MKIIIVPVFKFIMWWLAVVVGIVYSTLYFVYDPKALIKEKKNRYNTEGDYVKNENGQLVWKINWAKTVLTYAFWCPFINS